MRKLYSLITCLTLASACFSQNVNYEWTKGFSGDGLKAVNAIDIDPSGNVYMTGRFSGTVDFNPGVGAYNLTASSIDAFVLKMDPAGNLLWVKSFGAISSSAESFSIQVDVNGHCYFTGSFTGTIDFDPGTGVSNLSSTNTPATDIFITKLDANGDFEWAHHIGGNGYDYGHSIALDNLGNVCLTGRFQENVDFDPGAGTNNLLSSGSYDAFVLKLDNSGSFIWAEKLGSNGFDIGQSISVDDNGNIYTTGSFQQTVDFDPGTGTDDKTSNGSIDVYISALDSAGNYLWAQSVGGTDSDAAAYINHDSDGNIYVSGKFEETVDFNPGTAVNNLSSNGNSDVFLLKLDSLGTFEWAQAFGGTVDDYAGGIAFDLHDYVYLTGNFQNTANFGAMIGSDTLYSAGDQDLFLTKLTPAGDVIWANSWGAASTDTGKAVHISPSQEVYLTGNFHESVDFDLGTGVDLLVSTNSPDIFLTKLSCTPILINTFTSATTIWTDVEGDSFQWIDCATNLEIVGETDTTFTASNNGTYAVVVSNGNCYDTSACVTISNVGISEEVLFDNIAVYPNPTDNLVTIAFGNAINETDLQISILDISGRNIYSITTTDHKTTIPLDQYDAGIYWIKISVGQQEILKKIIKR